MKNFKVYQKYVYAIEKIESMYIWDELDRRLQKCVRNQKRKKKKRLMEEVGRSVERNSFRGVVKIKRKYSTVISGLHICTKL